MHFQKIRLSSDSQNHRTMLDVCDLGTNAAADFTQSTTSFRSAVHEILYPALLIGINITSLANAARWELKNRHTRRCGICARRPSLSRQVRGPVPSRRHRRRLPLPGAARSLPEQENSTQSGARLDHLRLCNGCAERANGLDRSRSTMSLAASRKWNVVMPQRPEDDSCLDGLVSEHLDRGAFRYHELAQSRQFGVRKMTAYTCDRPAVRNDNDQAVLRQRVPCSNAARE